MKTVLITGASGLLGRAIYRMFSGDPEWKVIGLAFKRVSGDLLKVDLTSKAEVSAVFQQTKPNMVIHSAAERKPDVTESKEKETQLLNIEATRYLCSEAVQAGVPVLYMSTDYVFDGKHPPYKETDEANPLNKYGKSKLGGETVVMETSIDNIILRVPILYGPVETLDESAVTVLYEKVRKTSQQCVLSDYERRFPTHVDSVADVIKQIATKKMEDNSVAGIFHYSGDEDMTKYDMGLHIANAMNIATDHILADKTPSSGAPRPYNSQLGTERIEKLGISSKRPFKEAIVECLKPF